MTEPLLSVQNLKKYYPIKGGILFRTVAQVHAVDDVSFDVYAGETLGLVGESGCGKSTIAKTLLRLHAATAGKVVFAGQDLLSMDKAALREIRKDVQIIFQDPVESLNSRQTVGSILREPFIIHKMGSDAEQKKRVDELLERVGLPGGAANRYPHEFSGGQRQRIGIARAIALKPRLLICDEPVSALDVSIQSQIINLLLELQRELQLTMLFIAHDLSVVKHISDRIAVMYLGKIVETGTATELYQHAVHPYTRALINSIPIPDPEQKLVFAKLAGEVPSPINPPPGCYFHGRCPHVQQQCKEQQPALLTIDEHAQIQHEVACHLRKQFLQV